MEDIKIEKDKLKVNSDVTILYNVYNVLSS